MNNNNEWYYKPPSSNYYFYSLAVNTCLITPGLMFGTFSIIFPNSNDMVRISSWGMVVALAFHIYRLYTYRNTPRRNKSAYPVILFVFTWFCAILYLDEWYLENTDRWIMLCYVISMFLYIFWRWLKDHDDRETILWFLGINWLISVCYVLPPAHRNLMFLAALTSYGAMVLLQKRVREGTYWREPVGTAGYETDDSTLVCNLAVVSLVWLCFTMFIGIDTEYNRHLNAINSYQFFMPVSAAFHFVVSLYLASEYVLYILKKCNLLELIDPT